MKFYSLIALSMTAYFLSGSSIHAKSPKETWLDRTVSVEERIKKLNQMVLDEPKNYETKYYYASTLLEKRSLENIGKAQENLNQILKNQPRNPTWLIGWTHTRLGQAYAQLSNLSFEAGKASLPGGGLDGFISSTLHHEFRKQNFKINENKGKKIKHVPRLFKKVDWPLTQKHR